MPDLRAKNRAHSAEYAATGGAILGAAAYGDHKLNQQLGDRPKIIRAAREGKLAPVHAGRLAGKAGVWSARTTALPMLAYGAYGLARPNRKTERMRVGRDVVKPMVGNATLRRQEAKQQERILEKRDFSRADQKRLAAHKKSGRLLSLASGSMGVAALGLRAPSLAGVAVRRSARAAKIPALKKLADTRGRATHASNTLGVLAIGTGSVGSFNYAAQQKLENERDKQFVNPGGIRKSQMSLFDESPYRKVPSGQRIVQYPTGRRWTGKVVGVPNDTHTELLDPKAGRVRVNNKLIVGTVKRAVRKRDDAFLRQYRPNISPSAEQGYKDLKSIRRQHRVLATGEGTVAGLVGALTVGNIRRHGARLPTIAGLAGTGLSVASSAYEARAARGTTRRLNKIKAKGIERASRGELGPDRVGKRDSRRRAAYGAEAIAGAGVLTAASGNRIPEAVNAITERKRMRTVRAFERHDASGMGLDEHGRSVRLSSLSDQKPKKPPVTEFLPDGRPKAPKYDRRPPRVAAAARATERTLAARQRATDPDRRPFPTSRWEHDPKTGKKMTHSPVTGKRLPASTGVLRRAGVIGVGIPLGLGMMWHGARNAVEPRSRVRKLDRRDVDTAVTAGSLGAVAYHAPSFAEYAMRNRVNAKMTAEHKARIDEWKTKHGVHGAQKGDPRWKKAYRDYPKDVPGGRTARIMSRTHVGPGMMAATAVTASAAAATAIAARRRKQGVSKLFLRIPKPNYARRIGAGLTTPRPRRGGTRQYASGVTATFRGTTS